MARTLLVVIIGFCLTVVGLSEASAQNTNPYCATAPIPRLVPGSQARVTPGLPNVIRSQPRRGPGSLILGQIPGGAEFTILAGFGPQCGDGMYWYYVSYNGYVGWTAEGSSTGTYWTEPVSEPGACLTPRLTVGGQGRVTPGLPNVIRSQPYRGSGSANLGLIPAGGMFTVLDGPSCAGGIQWWLVNYNGLIGWTGESQGSLYWVEPVTGTSGTCSGAPAPRMVNEALGVVTAGFGVPVFSNPAPPNQHVTSLSNGFSFYVLAGPVCENGVNWWRLYSSGVQGWVAETSGGSYVIEPVACPGFLPSRLVLDQPARLLPGLPNNLRMTPDTSATVVGQIPAGAVVRVINGPQCGNNGAWWYVNYNGVVGWTMEGQGNTYWMAPALEG